MLRQMPESMFSQTFNLPVRVAQKHKIFRLPIGQNDNVSYDVTLFPTPCWTNFNDITLAGSTHSLNKTTPGLQRKTLLFFKINMLVCHLRLVVVAINAKNKMIHYSKQSYQHHMSSYHISYLSNSIWLHDSISVKVTDITKVRVYIKASTPLNINFLYEENNPDKLPRTASRCVSCSATVWLAISTKVRGG